MPVPESMICRYVDETSVFNSAFILPVPASIKRLDWPDLEVLLSYVTEGLVSYIVLLGTDYYGNVVVSQKALRGLTHSLLTCQGNPYRGRVGLALSDAYERAWWEVVTNAIHQYATANPAYQEVLGRNIGDYIVNGGIFDIRVHLRPVGPNPHQIVTTTFTRSKSEEKHGA